jgi:hypothetical protein
MKKALLLLFFLLVTSFAQAAPDLKEVLISRFTIEDFVAAMTKWDPNVFGGKRRVDIDTIEVDPDDTSKIKVVFNEADQGT